MNTVAVIGAIVIGLMLAEARVSRRHEEMLRRLGATTPDGDVYSTMAFLYPAAFVAMIGEGLWRASSSGPPAGPNWLLSGVLMFVAGKILKYWAIHALGTRWTFKVFVVPGLPLVTTGPYRYIAHPNYVGVMAELAGTAMMCEAPIAGVIGLLAFGTVLWKRVQFEATVLRRVREDEGR